MVRSYRRPSEFELLGANENDSLNTSLDTNTFSNENDPPRRKKLNLIKVKIASVVAVILLAGAVALVLLYGTKKITEGGGEVNDALVDLNITTKISIPTTLNPEKTDGNTTTSSNRETNPTTKMIETETKTSYASTIHKNESKTTPSISEITLISTSPSSVAETTSILPTTIKLTPSSNEAKTPLSITQITENLTSPSTEAKKTSISESIEATTIPTSPTTIISTLQSTEVMTTSTSQATTITTLESTGVKTTTSQATPTSTLQSTEVMTTSTSQATTITTLESTEVKTTTEQATPTSTLQSTEVMTTSTSQATTISTSSSTQAIPTAQTTLSSTSASTQGIPSTSEKTLSSTSPTTKSIPSTSLTILLPTPKRKVETTLATTLSSTESNTSISKTTEIPNVTTTTSPSSTTITFVVSVQSTTPANFTTPTAFEPFTSGSTTPAGPRYPLPKSQIEIGTWYVIMSVFDGTVWDVYGGGLKNGAKIGLWPYLGQSNQHFRFKMIRYNQVTEIETRRSGMSVVYRSETKLFQQWDNSFSSNGLWKIVSVTSNAGVFQLRNEEFQKCASRKNTNLNSPDFLTLADCSDSFTYFRLIPVCDGI